MSSKELSAPRIADWVRWVNSCQKTEPTYKAKALLAVLEADGPKVLAAVLQELKLERTEKLIEAMRGNVATTKASAPENDE